MMPHPVRMQPIDVHIVMPGLVPGIHVFHRIERNKTWMAGIADKFTQSARQTAMPGHDDAAATGGTP
jgi:hypothetical protein